MDVRRHPYHMRRKCADIVLGPQNFVQAFDAVVKAVEDGRLTEQRIDQSVRRVLKLKKQIGR